MAMIDFGGEGGGNIWGREDRYQPDVVNDPGPSFDPGRGGQVNYTDPNVRDNTTLPYPGYLTPEEGYRRAHESPTGFYTNSPGPLYNEFGQRNDTPQPSAADVYGMVRSGKYYGTEGGANPSANALDNLMNAYAAYGYKVDRPTYNGVPSGNELTVNGQKLKFTVGDVGQPGTSWYDWGSNDQNGGGGGGGGGGYSNQGIFDDPATAQWLQLLMSRVNALNQPYQPPSLQPLTDYLKSYFEKQQGPAYTPQQLDLLQTQSLDPLSRERDAYRQRILENAAARGLDPKSGIVQKMISDADNKFEQIRTQTQAGFASKAVDLDRINAQQAAAVGQMLANIEQANFNQNEQRANQALGYAQQVPDLARQRMLDANTILSGSQLSPTQLLETQMNYDRIDQQNQAAWLSGLAQLIPSLLQLYTGRK